MRIREWSSDVCSSDLWNRMSQATAEGMSRASSAASPCSMQACSCVTSMPGSAATRRAARPEASSSSNALPWNRDWKSDEWGKRVHVRVDLGGRRLNNQNNKTKDIHNAAQKQRK